jgi:aminoglycoside phosphotransferase (APT) family kinase protein
VLDGQLGADGVRELVQDPMQYGLAQLLGQCLTGRERLSRTKLLRSKFKPGRKLTAYYELQVDAEVRPIAISWLAEPLSAGSETIGLPEPAASGQPVAAYAPFVRLTAQADGGQTRLLISPLDPELPQLMRLNDHSYLSSMIKSLTPGVARRPQATRIEAVRYRPGQRHVLRVRPAADLDAAAVFIKIDRDNRAGRAVRFAEAVGPLLSERAPRTSLVEPLGYAADDRAAVWQGVAGTALSQAVREPARGAAAIFLLGQAVRVLHDLDPHNFDYQSTSADLPVEQWSVPLLARTELESTLGAGQCLTALMPAVGARFRRLAMEVVDRLEELPAEDLRIGYGDLKCDNIIAADDRIWLLDLDRTGLADPAMDLGKLLADLRWWASYYSIDLTGVVRHFFEGYGPCDPDRLARARLIAVLYQLKLAARRIPVHEPEWAQKVTRHVDDAAASLRAETS